MEHTQLVGALRDWGGLPPRMGHPVQGGQSQRCKPLPGLSVNIRVRVEGLVEGTW